MKASVTLLITILALGTVLAEDSKEITVESMAPSVVKTVPVCGDMKVDPKLKEITVTFSKEMKTDRMWSICQVSAEHFPEGDGKIHYQKDDRTCIFPVKLEPGKTYALWFNRGKYNSFRDAGNRPAVPYQLVFKTKDKE